MAPQAALPILLGSATNGQLTCQIVWAEDIPQLAWYPDERSGRVYVTDGSQWRQDGYWMDFQEKHWGLTTRQYRALPLGVRAQMECQEQTDRWSARQWPLMPIVPSPWIGHAPALLARQQRALATAGQAYRARLPLGRKTSTAARVAWEDAYRSCLPGSSLDSPSIA